MEIRARGFSTVVAYGHTLTPEMATAFRDEGLAVVLQVWGTIVYGPRRLHPPPPTSARQVFRGGPQAARANPVFFCPNHDEYVSWLADFASDRIERIRPDGILAIETFLGDWPGPEAATYGCFCAECLRRFQARFPGATGFPEFTDTTSANHWRTNCQLYANLVRFRAESVAGFIGKLHAPIRKRFPEVALVGTMLALAADDGPARVRECNAQDARLLARAAPWDFFYLQAHWPDWTRVDLNPDEHIQSYKPFLDLLHQEIPGLPVAVLTDSGSNENMRRSMGWLSAAHVRAKAEGFCGLGIYEYAISRFIYEEAPTVIQNNVRAQQDQVELELVFSKRLEQASATVPANYALADGSHPTAVRFDDGNIVTLTFQPWRAGRTTQLEMQNILDDASTFWFNLRKPPRAWKYPPNAVNPHARVNIQIPPGVAVPVSE